MRSVQAATQEVRTGRTFIRLRRVRLRHLLSLLAQRRSSSDRATRGASTSLRILRGGASTEETPARKKPARNKAPGGSKRTHTTVDNNDTNGWQKLKQYMEDAGEGAEGMLQHDTACGQRGKVGRPRKQGSPRSSPSRRSSNSETEGDSRAGAGCAMARVQK